MWGNRLFLMLSLDNGGLCGHQTSLATHRYTRFLKVGTCGNSKDDVLIDKFIFQQLMHSLQSINFFKLGTKLCLVDLPGYGFAYAKEEVKEAWEDLVSMQIIFYLSVVRLFLKSLV